MVLITDIRVHKRFEANILIYLDSLILSMSYINTVSLKKISASIVVVMESLEFSLCWVLVGSYRSHTGVVYRMPTL